MDRFRCRALVLASLDYGEADRIITLLTDARGKLSAFAPFARKSRRRFSGALEPFTLLEARLSERRGDTLRLEEAEVIDAFGELRGDLEKAARAAYAVELAREICREREPQPGQLALLTGFLEALARSPPDGALLMRFELAALALAGLMPRLDSCARCGKGVAPAPRFDPGHGGLLCGGCAGTSGARISPQAAAALAALQRPGPTEALAPGVRAEARRCLSAFIAHHLGRGLKSLDFMREIGVEA